MEIRLYKCNKRYNSLYVVPDSESSFISIDVQIRGGVSITLPVFVLLSEKSFPEYYDLNYVYAPKWNRYYFIQNMEFDGNRTFISCKEDVLASWNQEILDSTFYCVRSASDYNENLIDMLFPAIAPTSVYSTSLDNPWSNINGGTYVVAVASGGNEQTHIGTNVYYMLDSNGMSDFMNALMSKAEISLSGLADSITKTMVNPIQYIRSVYWFPFELSCSYISSDKIDFSWWSADCETKAIWLNSNSDAYTNFDFIIPYREAMFNTERDTMRYQHFAPYSKYTFTCYPFGVIELPNALITQLEQGNDIQATITVDHITGMGELVIYNPDKTIPYIVTTAQIGVEIPVGEILQDYAGALLNSVGAVGSVVSGNVVGALNGVYNAIDSIVPTPTIQGIAGGFAQLMLDTKWSITRYYNYNYPELDLQGGICCLNKKVSDLTGYAQFSDVEITGTMLLDEKLEIQSLLESGVFI